MNDAELRRLTEATALLHQAHNALGASEDGLLSATGALVSCAAEAASAVADGDPESAQVALACARGAVVTATYLVRILVDAHKTALRREGQHV